jgi:hypothetical protein
MARIRSIKPEFWRSPSTAKASPLARLLYIAMWNWADDYGVAEWTPRELLGFVFPNDGDIKNAELQSLCTEVATCFNTEFYLINGRRYYCIPTWDDHQKNERRAQGKYPRPDHPDASVDAEIHQVTEMRGSSVRTSGNTVSGTGEQGNRGTGEQGNSSSSEVAVATSRPEIDSLLDLLDFEISVNGGKPPTRTKKNLDAARLLIDRDGRTVAQVELAIRWSQADEFWRGNILSMSKLREKYDQLRLAAQRTTKSTTQPTTKADLNAAEFQRIYGGGNERAGSLRAIDSRVSA